MALSPAQIPPLVGVGGIAKDSPPNVILTRGEQQATKTALLLSLRRHPTGLPALQVILLWMQPNDE